MSVTHSFRVLVHLFGGCSIALHFNFSRCINSLSFSLFLSQSEELILFKFLFVVYYCYFKKNFFFDFRFVLFGSALGRDSRAIVDDCFQFGSFDSYFGAISPAILLLFNPGINGQFRISFRGVYERFNSNESFGSLSEQFRSSCGSK